MLSVKFYVKNRLKPKIGTESKIWSFNYFFFILCVIHLLIKNEVQNELCTNLEAHY